MANFANLSRQELAELLTRQAMTNFLGAAEVLFKREVGGDAFDFYIAAIGMMVDRIGTMCDGEKPMKEMLQAMADQHCSYDEKEYREAREREQVARDHLRRCFDRMHGTGATPGIREHWPKQKNALGSN